MFRKAALLPALCAWLFPTVTLALGLGELDLKTALNQPLRAEIELLSAQPGETDTLKVALGSDEDFARVGVGRPFFLTKLKFSVTRRSDGTPYILITSQAPIREPFLDFVLEVTWASGRLLREYTVLVDPPALVAEPPAPVKAPVQAEPPKVARAPAAEELFPRIPVAPVERLAPAQAPAPTPTRAPAPTRTRAPAPAQPMPEAKTYGPIQRNDTLWSIAKQVRPDESISLEQMMLALLEANPEAFMGGNINNLKAGYVLRLPDREAITALSRTEAARESQRQYQRWLAARRGTSVTVAKPARSVTPTEPRIDRTAEEVAAVPSTREGEARLKVVAPEQPAPKPAAVEPAPAAKPGGEAATELQQKLALATEAADVARQENADLQQRIKELEEQMVSVQRLIALKDDQLAALQKNLEAMRGVEPSVVDKVAETNTEMNPYAVTTLPTPATAPAKPQAVVTPPKPTPVPQPRSALRGFLDDVMDSPIMLAGVVGVLLLLGALIWMVVSRRQVGRMEFQESILTGKPVSPPSESTLTGKAPTEDSSYMSDFSVSGIEGIQTEVNEVDPVAEADVYMAYGRYKQAEELIRDAIQDDPDRHELKLKMLEIYNAAKNGEAFEAQAEELYAVLGGAGGPMWDRVVEMGQQLCPENPLFGGVPEPVAEPETPEPAAEPEVPSEALEPSPEGLLERLDASLEAAAPGEALEPPLFEMPAEEEEEKKTADLSFETAPGDEPINEFETVPSEAFEERPELEPGLDMAAPEEPAAEGMDREAGEAFGENLTAFEPEPLETVEFDTDFTLEEAAEDLSKLAEEAGEAIAEEEEEPAFEFESLEPGEEAPAFEAEEPEIEESTVDGGLYAPEDEVGTKLDLAKAYIDMGDPEGARSILDEVLEEGSDGQKKEAQELLQQIA